MSAFLLIVGLVVVLTLLVLEHEFGHYIVARRNDVEVEEFGIFFPPKIVRVFRRKGTDYTINAVPMGGFVKLKGEHDSDTTPHSFGAASLWAKTKIMLAGVGMNLLLAFAILTFLAVVGMPKLFDGQFTVSSDTKTTRQEILVGFVEPNSPAEHAGLQAQDQLISIGRVGQQPVLVTGSAQLPNLTKQFAGQTVEVTFKNQQGQEITKSATLLSQATVAASQNSAQPKGYLGVSPTDYTLRRSTWSAPIVAVGFMGQVAVLTAQALGHSVASVGHGHPSQAAQSFVGPQGLYVIAQSGRHLGWQFILLLIGYVSLALALANLLPLPPLDGGRLYLLLITNWLKKPLSARREELINGIGMAVVFALMIGIIISDFRRFR